MATERPPSSLSMLADRLQQSTLRDLDNVTSSLDAVDSGMETVSSLFPSDRSVPSAGDKTGVWVRFSSSTAAVPSHYPPTHRHSADIYQNFYACNTTGSTAFIESSDLQLWEQSESDDMDDFCQGSSDHSTTGKSANSCSPPKRQCRSHSTGNCLPRPIALRPRTHQPLSVSSSRLYHSHHHCCPYHHAKATRSSPAQGRTLTSPYIRSRSAFTPTRPLTSPMPASSDYSLSPDTDTDKNHIATSLRTSGHCNTSASVGSENTGNGPARISAVTFRPSSVSSSGFHDSTSALIAEAQSLPDCSQMQVIPTSTPGDPVSSCSPSPPEVSASLPHRSYYLRCKSQPSFDPPIHSPCCCQQRPAIVGFKRRIGQTSAQCDCGANQTSTTSTLGSSAPTNAPEFLRGSPGGHEVFFFGSNRSYLVSLPRIASSPRRSSQLTNSSTAYLHQQPLNTFNVSSSAVNAQSFAEGGEKDELSNGMDMGIGRQNSGSSSGTMLVDSSGSGSSSSATTMISGNDSWNLSYEEAHEMSDEPRDPRDPPQIIEETHPRVLAAAASAGFCFKPLTKSVPPFQELDLDLIEND